MAAAASRASWCTKATRASSGTATSADTSCATWCARTSTWQRTLPTISPASSRSSVMPNCPGNSRPRNSPTPSWPPRATASFATPTAKWAITPPLTSISASPVVPTRTNTRKAPASNWTVAASTSPGWTTGQKVPRTRTERAGSPTVSRSAGPTNTGGIPKTTAATAGW